MPTTSYFQSEKKLLKKGLSMNIKNELHILLSTFAHKNRPELLKDREVYAQWLAQTYYFVRHSVPLLGYALPHLKNDVLKQRFCSHMGEEDRHDLMLIKDLEKLGRDISEFPEWGLTQGFYQSQYYRIQFEGATSFLGYILFLEALASGWGRDAYSSVKSVFPNATLFLRVHSEEDPAHVDEALSAILKLGPEEQQNIYRNMMYSAEIYQKMILQLNEAKTERKIA
jgi:hypothetical protein